MSDEQDKLKLSLEPPKLFGRKKKAAADEAPAKPAARRRPARPAAPAAPADEPATTPASDATDPAPRTGEERAPQPAPETLAEPATGPDPEEAPAAEERWAPTEPAAASTDPAAAEDVEPTPEPAPAPAPVPQPGPAPVPTPAPQPDPDVEPAPAPVPTPEPEPVPAPLTEKAAPAAPAAEAARSAKQTAPAAKAARPARPAKKTVRETAPAAEQTGVDPALLDYEREDAEILRAARADEGPMLERYPAAALTGGVVGVAAVALIWLFLRGCEAVRGTSSCGGGPGFLLLLVTFAVCVVLGTALLRTFAVKEPGTTSFLAAGVVAAVSLTFLVDLLDNWPIVVIVPLLAAAAYVGSVKLTDLIEESAPSTPDSSD